VSEARILGAAEIAYFRHPDASLLAQAARLALQDADLKPRDVDGLGVSSFSLAPDRPSISRCGLASAFTG
jgi:3-oxoacyl-[acyl-carrier-protein] synthase III